MCGRKKWKVPFWSNLLTDQVTGLMYNGTSRLFIDQEPLLLPLLYNIREKNASYLFIE